MEGAFAQGIQFFAIEKVVNGSKGNLLSRAIIQYGYPISSSYENTLSL
jgi:xanthine dehydrogenase molybdopterin-binding subunit B